MHTVFLFETLWYLAKDIDWTGIHAFIDSIIFQMYRQALGWLPSAWSICANFLEKANHNSKLIFCFIQNPKLYN